MATLKDVAKKAGVNISTASRALNGMGNISEVIKIDGVFLSCTVDTDRLSKYQILLNSNHIPLIALDARQPGAVCSQINVDDTSGMVESIQYLLHKGHTSIGYLGDYIIKQTLREDFFREALTRCGLHPQEHPTFTHPTMRFEPAGYEGMKYFLSLPQYPSAYLAGYDDIAIGAMRAVAKAGLRIPEDIAIIGNDNGRAWDFLPRRLTTLAPSSKKWPRSAWI